MPAYDGQLFNPAAPLARVTLRLPNQSKFVSEVPMLIDSGADVTLVPQQSVTLLSAVIDPTTSYEVMGFDGHKSITQVVTLDLVFLRRVFKGRFLLTDQECGVLGRDVLNHVALLLDGPRLDWDERNASGK
jgi:hypothetical protein